MNSRERFLTTIHGGIADRVPIVANLTEQLAEKLSVEMNLPVDMQDSFLATRISHRDILLRLGNDAVLVAACRAKGKETKDVGHGRVEDEFQIQYEQVGLYSEAVVRPLAHAETAKDVADYAFPKAEAEGRFDHARMVIEKCKDDYGIIGDLEASIFELAWNLVGMEKFLMDLYTEEEYVEPLLDAIEEYTTQCGMVLIDLGVDMIWTGDDIGTQNGMMISPNTWEEYLKPRMKRMFAAFKARNPKIVIAYHSCGAIREIIPGLIDAGLDILNPIQPLAENMELGSIVEEFGDRLLFFGGVDVQDVLPNGSVQDVENEVRRVIKATRGGKGYIIAPAHNMQPDTPVENIYAFYEAVKKYGVIEK